MEYQKELLRIVDRYAANLKKKMDKDMEQMTQSLDGEFNQSKPEIRKLLLENIVDKLNAEVDQVDTQTLIHFAIKFSEMINLLVTKKLTDFSPISVNGYVFTPNGGIPSSIDVEREGSKAPLGKIAIGHGEIIARTPVGEKSYYMDDSYVKDEIVMSVLGNYITKLNTRT